MFNGVRFDLRITLRVRGGKSSCRRSAGLRRTIVWIDRLQIREPALISMTLAKDDFQMGAIRFAFGKSNSTFAMVQDIRSDLSDQTEHPFDEFSYHYVLMRGDFPVGSMSVQKATDGVLDCESNYPSLIREQYQDQLFSSCKFRIRPGEQPALLALRLLVRSVWTHQIDLGAKISIINVSTRMKRFYQRIGFSEIVGYDFIHPVLHTHSHVMLMTTDPTRRSFCQDIFENCGSPLSQSEVAAKCIHLTPNVSAA